MTTGVAIQLTSCERTHLRLIRGVATVNKLRKEGRANSGLGIDTFFARILVTVALCNRADHYIFALWFLLFFSPNLSRRRLEVCHTSTHGVALALSANFRCKSEMCCARFTGNAEPKKSPKIAFWAPSHNCIGLYLRNEGTYIDNRKKNLLNSNISSTCPDNMENFGLVAAEIGPVVWGTPANFNGFRVLAALLHGSQV